MRIVLNAVLFLHIIFVLRRTHERLLPSSSAIIPARFEELNARAISTFGYTDRSILASDTRVYYCLTKRPVSLSFGNVILFTFARCVQQPSLLAEEESRKDRRFD